MSQIIPIYIPTYINSEQYAPARVLPRLFFYNGLIDCQTYYIESGSLTTSGVSIAQNAFPYFDNYNVVSGSFPTTDSLSLLFNNEAAVYGQIPTENLYTTYWEKYISLLYNPRTRLLNASAIIPLADYFDMELNDIVSFRGNYYHLRAINEYSLQTGECTIQLLGPIIADTISQNAEPCRFDFSVSNQVWTVTKCDNTATFTGVTFNTTASLSDGKVIKWGSPGELEGCYTITSSMDAPDLTGSIVYNVFDNCINCNTTTTTTTTTTSTTTTTLSPYCVCYEVVVTSDGGGESFSAGISYLPCDGGTNVGRNFLNPGTYYQCARVIGGLPQIEFTFGTGTISPVGSCNSGTCPPATTTTTTTLGPTTTTTTTAYDYYLADEYSCNPCTFQQNNVLIAFPAGSSLVVLNRYYKPEFITGFVYKNFTPTTAGPAIIMTVTGNSINCDTACATTTTTTAGYTIFLLTYSNTDGQTACNDYATPTNRNAYFAAPGATLGNGTILYTTSALTTPVANGYYSNGTYYWNTAASVGMLANQTACAATTTTTTQTVYNVGIAPGDVSACSSPVITANITTDNNSFCSANFIYSSALVTLSNGSYYAAFGGNTINFTITGAPTTTGTVTSAGCSSCPATTTTTAAPTYNYYDVTRFTCPSCTSPTSGIVARNNTTGGTKTTGNYYNNGDGYVYRIDGYNAGPSYTVDLDGSATAGTNCSATCAI